ncbi:hypothetical protein Rhal01_03622 [Rubritalea halochordaticola]|uniref:Uncharacterized protein n=1 Tax=Rubritalea halochordaticola TaxID=714537 RepID=A0ABP9V447_9BACT
MKVMGLIGCVLIPLGSVQAEEVKYKHEEAVKVA